MRGGAALLLLVVTTTACGPQTGSRTAADVAMDEICAVEPPAERPTLLTEVVPDEVEAWLAQFIRPAETPAEARARAESALASWRTMNEPGGMASLDFGGIVLMYLQLLEAAYLLEGLWPADAVEPPADLAPLLEPVYDGLRLPAILSGGFVQQFGALVAQILADSGAPSEVLVAGIQLLRILPDRSRVLHRHVALPIVCGGDAPAAAAVEALRHLAAAARDTGEWTEGLALRREVVRREPGVARHVYALAMAAFRAGRTADGDAAAAEADALCGGECDDRPSDLDACSAAARTLEEIGDPADAEERLARAGAMATLGRTDEARTLYEETAEELPEDARPRTGLARLAMTESLDVAAALPLLESAGEANRDGEYWELLMVCRAMATFYGALPQIAQDPERIAELLLPALEEIRVSAAAYLEFEPSRASPILVLVEAAQQAIDEGVEDPEEAAARALGLVASRALELSATYPESAEVAKLVVAAALFAPTGDEAFAALERPVPERLAEDFDLLVRRASLQLNAVVRWEAVDQLARTPTLIDAIPADAVALGDMRAVLRADLAAVAWRLAAPGATAEATRDAYAAAAADEKLAAQHRPRVVGNLGVVLAALGDAGGGAERLRRAEELTTEDADIPRFNRHALAVLAPDPPAEALEALREEMTFVAESEGAGAMRRQALRWLAWLADREGLAEDAAAFLRRAEEVPDSPFFTTPTRADHGLIARGNFSFGLGYSSLEGLVINLDTGAWIWLLIVPPQVP